MIQGDAVRVVLEDGADAAPVRELAARHGGGLDSAVPRFEDAFIDLLGGGPGGHSSIAERMDAVDRGADVAVSCRALTKRFGDFLATDNVTFDVAQGEIFGLLGPNGAGKSTTFKMLCGLWKPTSGEARVGGCRSARAPKARRRKNSATCRRSSRSIRCCRCDRISSSTPACTA